MPTITAAGVATLDYIEKYKLVENARITGALLHEELRRQILPLPHVGSVQGVGLMAGVEFVADKATKAPFARSKKIVEKVVNTLFEKGLIVWPNVGQANGVDGDLVMLGPPLTIAPDEVHALVAMLRAGILESLEAV
jgi:adenosylmethionine-8-amino-7-oxononanoate aminotransferase